MDIEKLKYPIGKFTFDPNSASVMKNTWIKAIQDLPIKLNRATTDLSDSQLNLLYRPEGWSVAKVVHHLADSHINAYVRCKMALTENHPNINGYNENLWAETADASTTDIQASLQIISGVHARWAQMWNNMSAADFEKTYHHLGYKRDFSLMSVLHLYAWHSEHHLAHIHQALK